MFKYVSAAVLYTIDLLIYKKKKYYICKYLPLSVYLATVIAPKVIETSARRITEYSPIAIGLINCIKCTQ